MLLRPRPQVQSQLPLSAQRGLSRGEVLWTLLLGVAVVFAIVGSHSADRSARDRREVEDELRYLVGQIHFALESDPNSGEQWPNALHTMGSLPETWQSAAPLADYLAAEIFLPQDPEGRAYLLRRTGPRAWLLGAAAADGSFFAIDDASTVQAARDAGIAFDIRLP